MDETKYLLSEKEKSGQKEFLQDQTLQRAFVRSIEIIGEATKKIPDDLKHRHAGIEWKAIAAMRDRLIHAYFGVDYDIVWDVVTNKIPMLQQQIERILKEEQGLAEDR
ncbi:MAG: HepT-like ribonuclease domain-containing protein [Planctomycetota bacterium]